MKINIVNTDKQITSFSLDNKIALSVDGKRQLPSLENLCADIKCFDSSFKMDLLPLLFNCSTPQTGMHKPHEYWKMAESAAYTCQVIDWILDGKSTFFTNPTLKEIESLKAIKNLLDPIAASKGKSINSFTPSKLNVGESKLFPFARFGSNYSQMLCRVEKVNQTQSHIVIYSALPGISSALRGSEFFDVVNGPQTTGFYSFKNVPDKDADNFLKSLNDISTYEENASELTVKLNRKLSLLKHYFIDNPDNEKLSLFMKQQTSENGVVKSLNGLLFDMLGKESFKKMTLESKFCGLLAGVNRLTNEPTLDHCRTIEAATQSYQKLLFKNRHRIWIRFEETRELCDQISKITDKIKESVIPKSFPPILTEIKKMKVPGTSWVCGWEGHETISKSIQKSLNETFEDRRKTKTQKKSTLDFTQSTLVANTWTELPGVLKALQDSISHAQDLWRQKNVYRSDDIDLSQTKLYILSVVQDFFKRSTQLKYKERDLLSKEDAEKCLTFLANTMSSYQWHVASLESKHALSTKVTFLESLALAHRLALMADHKNMLSSFGMFIKPYKEQIENDPCFLALDNALLERFKGAIAYFDKVNEGKRSLLCDFATRQISVPASNFPEIALLNAYGKQTVSQNSKSRVWDGTMQPTLDPKASQFITQLEDDLSKESSPYADLAFLQNLRTVAFCGTKQFFSNQRAYTIMDPKPCEQSMYRLTYSWNSDQDWGSKASKINHQKNGLREYDLSKEKDFEKRYQNQDKPSESKLLLADPQYSHRPSDLLSENTLLKKDPKKWDFLYDLNLDLSQPEMQSSMILDLLTRDVTALKDPKHRRALELALFKVMNKNGEIISPLFESLKRNPSIFDHLDKLTQKGIQIFAEPQINSEKRDYATLPAFLFIVKLRSTLLKNADSLKISYRKPKEFAPEAFIAMLDRFETPTPSFDFLIDLRLTRLACLQQYPYSSMTTQQIAQATSDYIFIKSLLQENVSHIQSQGFSSSGNFARYFLAQLPSIPLWRHCIDTHLAYMNDLLENRSADLNTLMNAIVNKQIGETEEMAWTLKDTGWICATDRSGGEWKINLLLGEFFTPQGGLEQSSKTYDTGNDKEVFTKLTRELFPNPTGLTQYGSIISFKDERLGSIRCDVSKQTIERCINGEWYTYQKRPRLGDLYPAFLFTEYTAWIRSENGKILGVVSHLQTGQTAYTINGGEFFNLKGEVLVTPEKILQDRDDFTLCTCLGRDQSKLLQKFDKNVRIWGVKSEKDQTINLNSIEFPTLRDSKGDVIRFEWNSVSKRWYWSENKNFFISSHYHPFVNKFPHYLTLESESGTTKILAPKMHYQKSAEFYDDDNLDRELKKKIDRKEPSYGIYEFTINKGKYEPDIKTLPLEQRLYLIYSLLVEKNYPSAASYMDSLSLSDTLGHEEKKRISQILNSVEDLDDHSPNASALRLAVYSYATTLDPVGDYTSFYDRYGRSSKHSIGTIYRSYLNKVNAVDDPLVLSHESELKIADKILAAINAEADKLNIESKKFSEDPDNYSSEFIKEKKLLNEKIESNSEIGTLIKHRINHLKAAAEEKSQQPSSIHPKKANLAEFAYDTQIELKNFPEEDLQRLSKLIVLNEETKKYRLAENVVLGELSLQVTSALQTATYTAQDQLRSINKLISTTNIEQAFYQRAYRVTEQSIQKFLHASVRQDYLNAFQKLNPVLTKNQAEELRDLCIRYMISKADNDQLQRIADALHAHSIENDKENPNPSVLEQEWDNVSSLLQATRPFRPLMSPFSLLFEAVSGMRIKKKQFEILQKIQTKYSTDTLTTDELQGYLFELMMGEGGKTTVITSALLEILPELGFFPILLSHYSQFAFSKGTIQKLQKDRYGKDLIALDYSIKELNNPAIIMNILNKIKQARARKLPLMMKNSLLQTIELKIALDLEYSLTETPENVRVIKERNSILEEILAASYCEGKGLMILDECHLTLSKTEVNVTGGEPTPIPYEEVNLVRSLFQYMDEDQEIQKLIRLNENEQKLLTPLEYEEKVRPYLIRNLLEKHSTLKQLIPYKESFTRFVTDAIWEAPTEEDKKFINFLEICAQSKDDQQKSISQLTALAAVLLNDVFMSVFANTCNREFGRSPPEREKTIPGSIAGKVVPYLGARTPSEVTQFGESVRALFYQFMTVSVQGITSEQLTFLYEKLYESAQAQVHLKQIPVEETGESHEFFSLTGFNLKNFTLDQHLDDAVKHVNQKSSTKLLAEMELSRFHITEYPLIFRSNSVNLTDMLLQRIAFSGTAGKASFYNGFGEFDLDTTILEQIKQTYRSRLKQNRLKIHEINTKSIDAYLKNIFDTHPNRKRLRSIIDCGGFFEKYQNIEISRALLKYCRNSEDLKNIEGVILLHRDPKTKSETFAILKDPESEPIPLKDTTKDTLTSMELDLNNLFVFFGELQATGTDIPLAPDAVNLVNIDLKKTTFSKYAQASTRPRRFLQNTQDNDLVYYEKEKPADKVNEKLDLDKIFEILDDNDKRQVQEHVYSVYRAKIANVFRHRALELIRAENNFAKKQELYKKYRSFIAEERKASFYEQKKNHLVEIDTEVALSNYAQLLNSRFEKTLDKNLDVEKEQINKKLTSILSSAKIDVVNEILPRTVKAASFNSPVDFRNDRHVEVETETKLEVQFEKEQERVVEGEFLTPDISAKTPYLENPWNITDLSLEGLSSQIIPLQHCFGEKDASYAKLFPNNIHMSANFRRTFANELLPVTHKLQKPAEHILVVQDRSRELHFVLLSKQDAVFFEKMTNVCLFDLSGFAQTPSSKKALEILQPTEEFQSGLWFANLFEGRSENLSRCEELSEEIFSTTSKQDAFNYLLEKTASFPQKRLKVLQSDLFKTCHIETQNQKTFLFNCYYETLNKHPNLQTKQEEGIKTQVPRKNRTPIEIPIFTPASNSAEIQQKGKITVPNPSEILPKVETTVQNPAEVPSIVGPTITNPAETAPRVEATVANPPVVPPIVGATIANPIEIPPKIESAVPNQVEVVPQLTPERTPPVEPITPTVTPPPATNSKNTPVPPASPGFFSKLFSAFLTPFTWIGNFFAWLWRVITRRT